MTDKRAELVERMDEAFWKRGGDTDSKIRLSDALDIALAEAAKVAFEACACNGAAGAIRSLMSKATNDLKPNEVRA